MNLIIMNETEHTQITVNANEIIEHIVDHPTHWVFVDGTMVARETISDVDWESVESVNLVPAVVGGY